MGKLNQLRRPGVAILTLVVASGCSWNSRMQGPELPKMHKNLSRTVDIQTGIVQGDLDKVHRAARWILTQDHDAVYPESGAVYEEELLHLASKIAEAEDIGTAARHTGDLAATCGSCHAALDVGPNFVVGNDTPTGDTQEAQMIRHLWAADRMWEGLVGPSDEAWKAGTEAMAQTQPALAHAYRASTRTSGLHGFLDRVNALAKGAVEAQNQAERASVYGDLLATCNQCHTPMGILVGR